jgi:hypothetical protein
MTESKTISYEFLLPDKTLKKFDIEISSNNIIKKNKPLVNPPEWCKLDVNQCPHCPLKNSEYEFCPVSLNLVDIVEDFGTILSFQDVKVRVTTSERQTIKTTSAQNALSSLMGLIIATSECPVTNFFKPMAWFHMPFATYEETLIRAVATYSLYQYFKYKEGEQPDLDLKGLAKIYKDIQILNKSMANRLKTACTKDSPINALVSLDIFAQCFPLAIENTMEEIKFLFYKID